MKLPNKKALVVHSEFYQTRKKQLFKILKGFKKEGLIERFELSPSIPGSNIVCLNIYLLNLLECVKVNICKSSHESWLKTTLRFSNKLEVIIGDNRSIKHLNIHLHEYFTKRVFGIFTETKFSKQLAKNSNAGLSFERSSMEDDRKGVDFWIYYNGFSIPLQIKTSYRSQTEHIKKFPKIPSILYLNKRYSDSDLYIAIFDICLEYINGNILHICKTNKQNSPNY